MSRIHSRTVVLVIAAGIAAAAVACSKTSSMSPSGPSAVTLPEGFQTAGGALSPMAGNPHGPLAGNETPGGPPSGNQTPGGPTGPRGPKVAGEGTVASLSGDCPTVTMVVRDVRVTTTDSTTYEIGGCGNLRPGTKVLVEGDFVDGSVTATSILITDQPGGHPVAGEGTVGSLRGTCDTGLTMVVRGYPVMTTSTTTFTPEGSCADIRSGSRISVTGDIFGNSVLATEVELLPAVQ